MAESSFNAFMYNNITIYRCIRHGCVETSKSLRLPKDYKPLIHSSVFFHFLNNFIVCLALGFKF